MPPALLVRLYDIEEISATRRPLPSAATPASKKRPAGGARPEPSAREARRDGTAGRAAGALDEEQAANFLRALEMSEDDDSFPTRVAWELQSELWSQQTVEVCVGGERGLLSEAQECADVVVYISCVV